MDPQDEEAEEESVLESVHVNHVIDLSAPPLQDLHANSTNKRRLSLDGSKPTKEPRKRRTSLQPSALRTTTNAVGSTTTNTHGNRSSKACLCYGTTGTTGTTANKKAPPLRSTTSSTRPPPNSPAPPPTATVESSRDPEDLPALLQQEQQQVLVLKPDLAVLTQLRELVHSGDEAALLDLTGYPLLSTRSFDVQEFAKDLVKLDQMQQAAHRQLEQATRVRIQKHKNGYNYYDDDIEDQAELVSADEYERRFQNAEFQKPDWKTYFDQLRRSAVVTNNEAPFTEISNMESKKDTPVKDTKSSTTDDIVVAPANNSDEQTLTRRRQDRLDFVPLPSRDQISSNPLIAQAEERLWQRIDKALEEYSETILTITDGQDSS